jgi:hypothetical protein
MLATNFDLPLGLAVVGGPRPERPLAEGEEGARGAGEDDEIGPAVDQLPRLATPRQGGRIGFDADRGDGTECGQSPQPFGT